MLLASACDASPRATSTPAISVQDDAGQTVRLRAPAQRIVSLVPSVTDIILALGAADRLVARTDFDKDPRLAHLPSVGQGLTPSIEWQTAVKPDLVVAWPDRRARSTVSQLTALGIPVYSSATETLEQTLATIRRVGVLLGLHARADSLIALNEQQLANVRRQVANAPHPSVLYVVGFDPPFIAGPHTFIDQLITIAGGANAFADARSLWPQVSLEEIVRRQPDVVIVAGGDGDEGPASRLSQLPGWRELRAVKGGHAYTIDASLFNRPGPNIGKVAPKLAHLLHPERVPR